MTFTNINIDAIEAALPVEDLLKKEILYIKGILSALRNPRVILTIKEHKNFVNLLKKFNINLSDYYI